ncbi:uncharacterized protein Gasu_24700 [Galdieria sulphuraria]|uniref:Uncharacterized protein n=1 Tax=Galdieria sulphuraria TaxID=130081 RepID=M2W312_GALSU|nr:uncharacterized protein Gasu_24700 [Galdieria sulphuraria]EME30086.1 hypothetical protein Gasu_24700 [Galdieria sulphuraria]|eukprot:XP_005706606.1 hypothetical protein Gasu_24700 [Galdieria sulphuraria]
MKTLCVGLFFLLCISYYTYATPLISSQRSQDSSVLYNWKAESQPQMRAAVNATAAPSPSVTAGEAEIQLGFVASTVRMAQKFGLLASSERTVISVTEEADADKLILDNASPYSVIEVAYVGSPSPFAVAFDVIVPYSEGSSYLKEVTSNTTFQNDLRTTLNLPTSYVFKATEVVSATPTPTVCYTYAAYGQYVPCTSTPTVCYTYHSYGQYIPCTTTTPYPSYSSSYSSSSYPQVPTYPFIPSF